MISLGMIPLGLIMGRLLKVLVDKKIIGEFATTEKWVIMMQKIALLGLNPVITLGAFWIVKVENIKLMIIPILGLSALILGGAAGFIAANIMKLEKKQKGALFVSASFTNIGTFGGLICYVFFGEASYAFVSIYKLLEDLYYYAVGFPIAKAHGDINEKRRSILTVILDPYILIALFGIIIGMALNISGMDRPTYYSTINEILIPVSSLLLVTSVGFNMRIAAIGGYIKECLVISMIKFMITPFVITLLAYFLGIGEFSDGLALKVIFVLSAMPPAFTSLIPPQLYNLDTDLANSSWLFNTGALILVVPLLYMIQSSFF